MLGLIGIGLLKAEVKKYLISVGLISTAGVAAGGIPTGTIIATGRTSAPDGYLLCDGSAVSRTTYADLFSAISTRFGTGDGSTTFNLPNGQGRSLMGADSGGSGEIPTAVGQTKGTATHTLTSAEMPAHTHTLDDDLMASSGAGAGMYVLESGGGTGATHTTNSTGGGGAHNNVHPVVGVNFIIKT